MVKVQLQYVSGTTAVYQLVEDIETRRFIARDMKKAAAKPVNVTESTVPGIA